MCEIQITRHEGSYRADMKCLPGTPPVGVAPTAEQAVANLFAAIIAEKNTSYIAAMLMQNNFKVIYA